MVASKAAAFRELRQHVNDVKRFVRNRHGIQSREYQSIKDNVFSRPVPKKGGADDKPTDVSIPVDNNPGTAGATS